MKNTPWFSTPGQPGDRTLEQQLMGLDHLWPEVAGKTVLDVGCAEGLISIECMRRGAWDVLGVDIRPEAVHRANRTRLDTLDDEIAGQGFFSIEDVNEYDPLKQKFPWGGERDIVLMLAVLHKLKDPSAACRRLVAAARDLVVIRLPPKHAPDIVNDRSGGVIHRIGDVMADCGFDCERAATDGPFSEWIGYYRRAK